MIRQEGVLWLCVVCVVLCVVCCVLCCVCCVVVLPSRGGHYRMRVAVLCVLCVFPVVCFVCVLCVVCPLQILNHGP